MFPTLAAAVISLLPFAQASLPNLAGTEWKTTLFTDDFKGTAGKPPAATKWIMDTGTSYANGPAQWGTGEIETYTNSPNNVRLSGKGSLFIQPIRDSTGAWTSARIETIKSNFVAPAGGKLRIEANIRMPQVTPMNGQGYWPAFWTLGARNGAGWPGIGEYDIMENVNALPSYNSGLHCGTYNSTSGGACNEPSGLTARNPCPSTNCNGYFHTYTAIVDRSVSPETLGFYVDGQLTTTLNQNSVGVDTWNNATHHGHVVILNVAMGGAYPNALAGGTTPTPATISGREMRVDYVGVWTT